MMNNIVQVNGRTRPWWCSPVLNAQTDFL